MYGAHAQRVPAKGGAILTDVDMFKIAVLGRTERGIAVVQDEIYSMSDYYTKCGGYTASSYAAYVADAFYAGLEQGVTVEMKVRSFIPPDAVQASATVFDSTSANKKAFDIKAGYMGYADKSNFGNKVAYQSYPKKNLTYLLNVNAATTAPTVQLTNVDGWEVGYLAQITDGTQDQYGWVSAIDRVAKVATFSPALANTAQFTVANTTVYRVDWDLLVGLEDDKGSIQSKEEYLSQPMFRGDTKGMPSVVNHSSYGSKFVTLAYNAANTTAAAFAVPVTVSTWTKLALGADGTAALDADWNTLAAQLDDVDHTILLAPESSSVAHNNNMAVYCTLRQNSIYYGQAGYAANEASLKALGGAARGSVVFGMIPMDKWISVSDPLLSGSRKFIPPVGHAAAHWFNMYSRYGEGKVAAGYNDTLLTADILDESNALIHNDRSGVGDRLIRNYGINICRFTRGKGLTINSARTLSVDGGYVFQNQILGWLLIKKSILTYLMSVEQDKAGLKSMDAHFNAVWSWLYKKYQTGVFYIGQKEDGSPTGFSDVVTIVNDFSVNTLADIANGKETVFVQVIFAPPIEEPILNLASASVTTIKS